MLKNNAISLQEIHACTYNNMHIYFLNLFLDKSLKENIKLLGNIRFIVRI